MTKKVKVVLPAGWIDETANNSGGITFIRDSSEYPGALQVSVSEYKSGEVPNPSENELREMSVALGKKMDCGDLVESRSGSCALGKFGTAVFKGEHCSRTVVWHLSNGRDIVLVTHIFVVEEPGRTLDADEITEAEKIVCELDLAEAGHPWWKLWGR